MRYIFGIFVIILSFGAFGLPAHAAVVKIDSDSKSLAVGDVFTVSVSVDTENQALNAVDTKIFFPSEVLEYVGVEDGESVISLWIEKPTFDGTEAVYLSGITPGGFSSQKAKLLSLKFKAIKEGQGKIFSQETKFLLHDGLGTEATVLEQNLSLSINNGESSNVVSLVDDERPESFKPEIIQDPDVYGGRNTLIFSTKDKSSGVNRYEVKEGWFGHYQEVESPYELKNQNLDKKIYIKAIDGAGNERLEIIYPQNQLPWREHWLVIFSILTVCVLLPLVIWRVIKVRRLK